MPNQDMAADLLTARAEMIRFYPTPKTKKELVPFLLGFTLLDEKQLKDMCLQRLRIIAKMTKMHTSKEKSLPGLWKKYNKEGLLELYEEVVEPEDETYLSFPVKRLRLEIELADFKEWERLMPLRMDRQKWCNQCGTPLIWSSIQNTFDCSATMNLAGATGIKCTKAFQDKASARCCISKAVAQALGTATPVTQKANDPVASSLSTGAVSVDMINNKTSTTKRAKLDNVAHPLLPRSHALGLQGDDAHATKKAKKSPKMQAHCQEEQGHENLRVGEQDAKHDESKR